MENKKKRKLNFFDIVIVLVVVLVAAGAYVFTHKDEVVETKKLVYTFELTDVQEGFSELVEIGDSITDNVKNYHMGTVIAVEAQPYKIITEDVVNGKLREVEVPGRETCVITVEANVTEVGADYKVDGNYTVKAGLEVAAKGPGYAGVGYILTIDRGENV